MSDTEIFLELGDIIRINSETNKQYDKNIYYIEYFNLMANAVLLAHDET